MSDANARDYTGKDFDTLFENLRNKIVSYLPEWTDHNTSDFGIAMLELVANAGDILHFYINQMVREAFLTTATQRMNVIALTKLLGYTLYGAAPASVDLKFRLSKWYSEEVTIPAGTLCQSVADEQLGIPSYYFETDEDLVYQSGEQSNTVAATEGRTDGETVGTSDGSPYQKFVLAGNPIIDDTLKIFVDGVEWTEVDSFAISEPDAQEYYIQRDDDDNITVFFGDNVQGVIPTSGLEITATYRLGGGVGGNVGIGMISTIVDSLTHDGNPLVATVTNEAAASGGTDRETIAHAKLNAPLVLKTQDRCVTDEDYESVVESYAGVERAKLFPVEPANYRAIEIYIVPGGGGTPSQGLLGGIVAELDEKRMINDMVTVLGPDYVDINITLAVFVLDGYVQATIEELVNDTLATYFDYASTSVDFGLDIRRSDLYRAIDELEGVDYLDIDELYRVPAPVYADWQGGATIGSVAISSTTKEETWTIELTSPTTFKVTGSVSGLQTNTGTFDVPYVSDNNEIGFTITSNLPASSLGEIITFKTSKLLGNVGIDGSEFPQLGTVNITMSGGS